MTRVFIDDLSVDASALAEKLASEGVEVVRVSPYSPKNKGAAERAHRESPEGALLALAIRSDPSPSSSR
jgi:predicted nuclease with RNAse H fold